MAVMPLAVQPILASADAQTVGVNAAIRNRVEVRAAGTAQLRTAVLRQRVGLNDEVRTGRDSRLQILLLDRSVFTVGPNARLTIDRFVYDPDRGAREVGASITRGAFRFLSGRSSETARTTSVRTPVATIGIRGTIVEGVVGNQAVDIARGEAAVPAGVAADPETATLLILRGPGPEAQANTPPGAADVGLGDDLIALDRPSLALYVPGHGRAPIGPFVLSQEGHSRLYRLFFPIERDAGAITARERSPAIPLLAALATVLLLTAVIGNDDPDPVSP